MVYFYIVYLLYIHSNLRASTTSPVGQVLTGPLSASSYTICIRAVLLKTTGWPMEMFVPKRIYFSDRKI